MKINVILLDGDVTGRMEADLANRDVVVYRIPRKMVFDKSMRAGNLFDIHLKQSGIYFLLGEDTSAKNESAIYVGQADTRLTGIGLLNRIFEHRDDEFDWNEAMVLTKTGKMMDAVELNYLEWRFEKEATEANRYTVTNKNHPHKGYLDEYTENSMDEQFRMFKMLVGVLGVTAFEAPVRSKKSVEEEPSHDFPILEIKGKDFKASGIRTNEGFTLFKGSRISADVAKSAKESTKILRIKYVSKITEGTRLTKEDISFKSASGAASFVTGASTSGNVAWKTKEGVPLGELDGNSSTPEEPPLEETGKEIFHLSSGGVEAKGWLSENGFTVGKRASCSERETNSCPSGTKALRKRLIDEGKIKDWMFMEDVEFSSPSAAAQCLLGASKNGLILWKNDEGKTIKELKSK